MDATGSTVVASAGGVVIAALALVYTVWRGSNETIAKLLESHRKELKADIAASEARLTANTDNAHAAIGQNITEIKSNWMDYATILRDTRERVIRIEERTPRMEHSPPA